MFHTAKLIAWQHHHTVLLEGTGDARITLHPFQSLGCLVEHLVELCHLIGIGLTVEDAHGAPLTDGGLLIKLACDKRIEIGG